MNSRKQKTRKLLAGAASLVLAGGLATTPALALAGGSSHFGYGVQYGSGGHVGYSASFGHHGGRHFGGHNRGHHGGHHGGGHGLAYAVPLALFAGVLIANASRPRDRVVSYSAPPPPRRQNVWIEQPARTKASDQYCREYTTEIIINGEPQEAYGQACRQEDGTWKIMSQNLAPDFD
ncbi:MAG: hypothetical protein ACE5EM_11030 [Sphingomonadales bacterium]